MFLHEPIDSLPNTSSITIRRLKSLSIETYWDLLNFFPFRYEDYSIISPIEQLQGGEQITVQGKIIKSKNIFARTGLRIQKVMISDETGTIELNWYNQQYLIPLLHPGLYISASGETKRVGKKIILLPKEYEVVENKQTQTKHTGRLVPVYSEKKGLSSKTVRDKTWTVLKVWNTPEVLPEKIIESNNLLDEETAYREIHFPSSLEYMKLSKDRLSFDELFLIQLSSKLVKKEWEKEIVGNRFSINTSIKNSLDSFMESLPFKLTSAQKKAVNEILNDLQKQNPMNRFLQGEVGSGKTVVAAVACFFAFLNTFQSLIMAPTEILAEQHYQTISYLFNKDVILGSEATPESDSGQARMTAIRPNICLISGSKKPSTKELEQADIIIGTHALIQKKIAFNKVGFVVIDEQHRFGVAQRAELKNKGLHPHLLTMTATPIPRTVMLTLYGELDMSVLDEMPEGRLPIKTYYIPKHKRNDCYNWIKKQINAKSAQVYIICPLIEESETLLSVRAAKKEFNNLKNEIFTAYRVGLLHGKLNSKEKNQVMADFKNKKYSILVATPVVEVGIDVPNATIMIIEAAERFGLAQLHQLRGRIGRGKEQSYCFVFSEQESSSITERLTYLARNKDGNTLAQKDLELRGPGNLYGLRQHGYLDLKIASMSDYVMIERTRKAVDYFMEEYTIDEFPELKRRVKEYKPEQISKD